MNGSIKDTKILFEEIKKRNPNFQNINRVYAIYEKIKSFYSENMKSISDEEIKRKIRKLNKEF